MTRKYRVAVLGLGHWYSAYNLARALPGHARAELVAAAWHDPAQLKAFTDAFGVRGYATYRELFEREEVDIVHLAAPVSELPELTIESARAGKHIVLGKPMAMRVEEADRMVEAVEAAGVTCVPFSGLTRLRLTDVKARIDKGEIGDIIVMHQTSRWSIAEDGLNSGKPGWFVDPRYVPGGALIDEGIYWIELFESFAGPIVRVEARLANLVHKEIAVEDWGMATFTFASGVVGTLEASWTINAPRKTGPSPKQNAVVRLEIVGTRGEIIDQWFRSPGRAVLAAGAADWVFERQPEDRFSATAPLILNHLIDCLDQKRKPDVTIQQARSAFRVAMAAYASARDGKAVAC
jgi:UDP-N-acetyl-2-amino-2-deoxyglucuronate dehydrogenase